MSARLVGGGGRGIAYTSTPVALSAAAGASAGKLTSTLQGTVSYSVLSGALAVNSASGALTTTGTAPSSAGSITAKVRAQTSTDAAETTISVPVQAALAAISPTTGSFLLGAASGSAILTFGTTESGASYSVTPNDGRVAVTSTGLVVGLTASSLGTINYTVTKSKAGFTPVSAVVAITCQPPVSLNALTLDNLIAQQGSAWSANIVGSTSGSTITATSSDGTVLTVSGTSVSGTFAAYGTPTITLAEAKSGSTRNSTQTNSVEFLQAKQNAANRGGHPIGQSAISGSKRAYKSLVFFKTGRQPLYSIGLEFANFFVQNSTSTPEASPGNTNTVQSCSLEFNGVRVQLAFTGAGTSTMTAGQTQLSTDQVLATAFGVQRIPPGSWVWAVTDGDVPSGNIVTGFKTNRTSPGVEQMCFYDPANRNNSDATTAGAFTVPTGATTGITGFTPIALSGRFVRPEMSVTTAGADSLVYGSLDATGDGELGGGHVRRACFTVGCPYFSMAVGGHELAYYSPSHGKRATLMGLSTHLYVEPMTNDLISLGTASGAMLTSNRTILTDAKANLLAGKYVSQLTNPFPRGTFTNGVAYDGTLAGQIPAGAFRPGERKDQYIRAIRQDLLSATYPINEFFDPRGSLSAYKQKWTLKTAVAAGVTSLSLIGTNAPVIGVPIQLEGDIEDGDAPMTSTVTTAAITGGTTTQFTITGSATARPLVGTRVKIGTETRVVTAATGTVTLTVNAPFSSSYASGTAITYHATDAPLEVATLGAATSIGATSFTVGTTTKPFAGASLALDTSTNAETLIIATSAITGSAGAWVVPTITGATKAHASGVSASIGAVVSSFTGTGTSSDPFVVALTGPTLKAHPAGCSVDGADLWPVFGYASTITQSISNQANGNPTITLAAAPPSTPIEVSVDAGTASGEWGNILSMTGLTANFADIGLNQAHTSGAPIRAVSTGDLVHLGVPGHIESGGLLATRMLTWPIVSNV